MGSVTSKNKTDFIHPLTQKERIELLVYGYIRKNNKYNTNFPLDIGKLCYKYTDYDQLILSQTEIKMEQELQMSYKKQSLESYSRYYDRTDIKIMVIGMPDSGKTKLCNRILRYMRDNSEYDPTILDIYKGSTRVDDEYVHWSIWNAYTEYMGFNACCWDWEFEEFKQYNCTMWVYSVNDKKSFVGLKHLIYKQQMQCASVKL